MVIQTAINAVVQVGLVLLIAVLVWGVIGRKRAGFFTWLGLYAPGWRAMRYVILVCLVFIPVSYLLTRYGPFYEMATSPNSIAGQIAPLGPTPEAALIIVLTALIKTSLSEELLFRGVIGKRCMNAFGFTLGNVIQAGLFCALHVAFLAVPGMPEPTVWLVGALIMLVFPLSWCIGWVNEKTAGGSIVPGWIIHGVVNLFAYPLLAFLPGQG